MELIYYYYDRCIGNCSSHRFLVVTLVFLLKGLVPHVCVFIRNPLFCHVQLFLLPRNLLEEYLLTKVDLWSICCLISMRTDTKKKSLFHIFYQIYYCLCKTSTGLQNNHWYHLISLHVIFLPPSLLYPPPKTKLCT